MQAPIAFFTYNRPRHTEAALAALQNNSRFAPERLFIFCDGARRPEDKAAVDATRAVVEKMISASTTIIKRDQNWGLAKSIIDGVNSLTEQYGSVIVVEDDLVTSQHFLDYMDRGLELYKDDERVMQLSGHMFPIELKSGHDAVFLPFTTSWGWATWRRSWIHFDATMKQYANLCEDKKLRRAFDLDNSASYFTMLTQQAVGNIDSWAIRWYLSVFFANGLTLFPTQSLVSNIGFDGSGTHCRERVAAIPLAERQIRSFPPVEISHAALQAVKNHLRRSNPWWRKLLRRIATSTKS